MRAFKVWSRCLLIAFILMFVFQAASHAEHENAAYCYRCCVVCVSHCLFDTTRSPIKTAEPIQLPFGMWTRIDTKKACISRGSGSWERTRLGDLLGHVHTCRRSTHWTYSTLFAGRRQRCGHSLPELLQWKFVYLFSQYNIRGINSRVTRLALFTYYYYTHI